MFIRKTIGVSNSINDMMLTLLSGFAQMERDFISERKRDNDCIKMFIKGFKAALCSLFYFSFAVA